MQKTGAKKSIGISPSASWGREPPQTAPKPATAAASAASSATMPAAALASQRPSSSSSSSSSSGRVGAASSSEDSDEIGDEILRITQVKLLGVDLVDLGQIRYIWCMRLPNTNPPCRYAPHHHHSFLSPGPGSCSTGRCGAAAASEGPLLLRFIRPGRGATGAGVRGSHDAPCCQGAAGGWRVLGFEAVACPSGGCRPIHQALTGECSSSSPPPSSSG